MAEEIKKSKIHDFKKNIVKGFRDLKSELKKVIWPSKEQLFNNTLTVLLSCIIVGIIIWAIDGSLNQLRGWLYQT